MSRILFRFLELESLRKLGWFSVTDVRKNMNGFGRKNEEIILVF